MHGTAVDVAVGAAGATGGGIVSIGGGTTTERSLPTRPPSLVAIRDIARPGAIKRPAGGFCCGASASAPVTRTHLISDPIGGLSTFLRLRNCLDPIFDFLRIQQTECAVFRPAGYRAIAHRRRDNGVAFA